MPRPSASTSSMSRSLSAGGSDSTSRRSAVRGVRSRWARSAAPSRSAASSSPIRPASWLTAAPTSRTSVGPAGVRARREVAGAQAVGGRRQLGDRPGHRARQPVGDQQGQEQQDDAEAAEHQPGPRHAGAQHVGRDEHLDQRRIAGPVDRLEQEGAAVRPDLGRAGRHLDVGILRVAEPRSVGPAHTGAELVRGADQAGRRPRSGPPRPTVGVQELHLRLGRVQGPRLGDPGDQGGGGQQEGQQHDRRGRGHQQGDLAPHDSGSASRTPTPRTVCSSRGSAALSPSLRRSHDRWTSTVLSDPPYGSCQTSPSSSRLVTTVPARAAR